MQEKAMQDKPEPVHTITEKKRALRKTALVKRDALMYAQRIKKSGQIAQQLFVHPWYREAEHLLVYASYLSEVSTEEIIRHALQAGKRVYCPVVTGKREMMFCEVLLSGLGAMEKDSHGIPQPDRKTCAHYVYESEKSLMLMPGCAFNDRGDRIGYGGGFYDSFLAKQPMRTIALFFDCQHIKAQNVGESHDVRPDLILTESGFREKEKNKR